MGKKIRFITKLKGDNKIRQKSIQIWLYTFFGDDMKVKVFDEEHEKDLEDDINKFLEDDNFDVIDIKFSSSCSIYGEEQIYCFTALIMYDNKQIIW